jgi:lipopolysaccharide export system protein LptC
VSKLQRGILLTALLASLAAAGLHLMALQTAGTPGHQAHAPDLYIEQPRWRLFDKNGRLNREMRAGRLEQWPGEARARLTEPRLQLTDRQQQIWQATAQHGWIPEDQRSVMLDKQVRLQREPATSGLVVTTERLRIADKGDFIETDQPVVLTSGNWHFSATGLRAELGRQQLELLGNVRGIHD